MSFEENVLHGENIKRVLHVGADRGGELPQYHALGVETVIWIEANPEVYQEMLDNFRDNYSHIPIENKTFCQLISDKDDVLTDFHLYYGWDAGYLVGNKGMSSMLKADPNHWSAQCHRGTLQLNSLTLDTFLERNDLGFEFDLLNMDVQGAELLVCAGARKVLENVKFINIEMTLYDPQYQGNPLYKDIEPFLNELGFKEAFFTLSAPNWGDAIFKKRGI